MSIGAGKSAPRSEDPSPRIGGEEGGEEEEEEERAVEMGDKRK